METVIGVDCGGTHITGQTWDKTTDRLIQEVTGGPGNIVLNEEIAMANLTGVLDELIAEPAGQTAALLVVGIAGIETAGSQSTVQRALEMRYHKETVIISDAKLALLNGLQGKDGALVIAGTGSVVYGRQAGAFLRAGGFGYLLGDEGSAYDIATRGVKAALSALDHDEPTALTQTILTALGAASKTEIVSRFYARDRKTNAELAMPVAKLAEAGDAEAVAIVQTAATTLATQVVTLLDRFDSPKPNHVALSGTVLQQNTLARQTLIDTVHAIRPGVRFTDIPTNNAHAAVYWDRWTQ